MPPRARTLREHLSEGSFRARYARLLLTEPLDEAPPAAYAMIDDRVGPLWHRLTSLQDVYVAAPGSGAAEALGVERYRVEVVRQFAAVARELHSPAKPRRR